MKTVIRLHFSRLALAVRVSVLIVVVAALGVMIVGSFHRTDNAWPTGNDRNAPSEQSHYNFPTYA